MGAKRDFTDRYLKALKPAEPGKRPIFWDAQVPQFGIRVTDKSTKENVGSFVLVARFPGSSNPAPRRIGDFPAMGLAQARQIAREWRDVIAKGVDPKVKEAERRRAEDRRRADTFGAAFEAYAAERLSRLRTGAEVQKAIERYALPKWGTRPISEIRRADVKELIRGIHKDAPVAGNRTLAYLKTFFAWAAEEELIEASPASAVKPLADEVRRDRVLSDVEIRTIWLACGELGAFGRAFRFMLATGQRRTECGELTWREINREARLWTLPRERAKADRSHEIPLSELAMEVIDGCPKLNDFVFTTGRGATATGAATPIAGWSKAKTALDNLASEKLKAIAIEQGEEVPAEIPEWHLHDLRRTCATNLAKLGVDRIVISKILNHAEGGVTGIYDRHSRDPEKRMAMDLWGQRLQAIVSGTDGGNVVVLHQGGRK
jgi:integrase